MSLDCEPTNLAVERFDRLYAADPDPWHYRTSAYEREKYASTLEAVGPGPHARALEVGCANGVFTTLLAPRCGDLVAIDFSARAVELARESVAGLANVEIVQAAFPHAVPDGNWDLVVCSEVLYYLDDAALLRAAGWLTEQLVHGATVVAVSWRGEGVDEPLLGDDVHDILADALRPWHALDARAPGYRLDRFAGDGR
jgi:SAM-dependent methyltransferase